jgi:hypothetical protein
MRPPTVNFTRISLVPDETHHDLPTKILISGELSATIQSAFPGLRAPSTGAESVLSGALPDQAALYGILTGDQRKPCHLKAPIQPHSPLPAAPGMSTPTASKLGFRVKTLWGLADVNGPFTS